MSFPSKPTLTKQQGGINPFSSGLSSQPKLGSGFGGQTGLSGQSKIGSGFGGQTGQLKLGSGFGGQTGLSGQSKLGSGFGGQTGQLKLGSGFGGQSGLSSQSKLGSGFGGQTGQLKLGSGFGGQTGLAGQSNFRSGFNTQIPDSPVYIEIQQMYNDIGKDWTKGEGLPFTTMCYNLSHPRRLTSGVPMGLHPKLTELWNEAEENNPDPDLLEPEPVVGFSGLIERTKKQKEEMDYLKTKDKESITSALEDERKSVNRMRLKLEALKQRHWILAQQLVRVAGKTQLLDCLGVSETTAEQQFRMQLEQYMLHIQGPAQMRARLTEVVSELRMQDDRNRAENINDISPEDEEILMQLMEQEKSGLDKLCSIIKKDLRDLSIMNERMYRQFSSR